MAIEKKVLIENTGADFKRFWSDKSYWLEGMWVDDFSLLVNGALVSEPDVPSLLDSDMVCVNSGFIADDTDGLPTAHPLAAKIDSGVAIADAFADWLKSQTTSTLVVEFDVTAITREQLLAALATINGVKVLS